MQTYCLKVKNLSKTYQSAGGDTISAVKNVSFQVEQGQVYGLIGLSGAGKSTLVRCLNLLEHPDSGEILFNGEDLTKLSNKDLQARRKQIGMIFQHFNLLEQKTVFENVAFPLRLAKLPEKHVHDKVEELLTYVDLLAKKDAYPIELSGGQKQRVAIARTLAAEPKLLLSDEGTSALDPQTTDQILELLAKARRDYGLSIVLITHQMEVARKICDRIAVMEDGVIVEENEVEELFLHPKHPRTLRLVQNGDSDPHNEDFRVPEDFVGKVYRLSFLNSQISRPVISELSRNFDLSVNIFAGNIQCVNFSGKTAENKTGKNIGFLNVSFDGEEEQVEKAMTWLQQRGVAVEEIQR